MTPFRRAYWERNSQGKRAPTSSWTSDDQASFDRVVWESNSQASSDDIGDDLGAVGALVLDSYGHLAAGGSTGGTAGRLGGQVADTAVLGAGLFANDRVAFVW